MRNVTSRRSTLKALFALFAKWKKRKGWTSRERILKGHRATIYLKRLGLGEKSYTTF